MSARKIIVLLLISLILSAFCSCSCAAQKEGYFGDEDLEVEDAAPAPEPEIKDFPAPIDNNIDNNGQEYKPPVFPYDDVDQDEAHSSDNEPSEYEPLKKFRNLERYSEKTEKVLRSYGLDEATFDRMLDRHKDAENGVGNQEKFDRYEILFNEYPFDYLAAYRAAQANMAMGRKGQAETWLNKALNIHPNYIPAKQLLKKARAR